MSLEGMFLFLCVYYGSLLSCLDCKPFSLIFQLYATDGFKVGYVEISEKFCERIIFSTAPDLSLKDDFPL